MVAQIPSKTSVLVIGGGPGGSYTAAALAREGIDTVVLEADKFPRYHIGESLLASIRDMLKFIDLDEKFNSYGFVVKPGARFRLNPKKREGYTNFLAAGPDSYAWNVLRSESDDIMLNHSKECGAKVFDGVRIQSIEFEGGYKPAEDGGENLKPGRPISATYKIKETQETGTISFDFVVDASGRAGILSTKYMKNRRFNEGLKNVANWSYWEGTNTHEDDPARTGAPYFEALQDESGWAWFIPLHNGTTSVGVVENQKFSIKKKQNSTAENSQQFYLENLKLAPHLLEHIGEGKQVDKVKSASDYSYSASSYAFPYARIVGDAGSFIDPYFSSGVHLAVVEGLSAATTIAASIRGDVEEAVAADWHSQKTADSYNRFLLVVLSAYKQIRSQNEPVLSDIDEDNFDRAFALFRPIIQGTADVEKSKLTAEELRKTLEFCANAFEPILGEAERAVAVQKIKEDPAKIDFSPDLTEEQNIAVKHIRARQMMRTDDIFNNNSFGTDVIDGLVPNLQRGSLGLKRTANESTLEPKNGHEMKQVHGHKNLESMSGYANGIQAH